MHTFTFDDLRKYLRDHKETLDDHGSDPMEALVLNLGERGPLEKAARTETRESATKTIVLDFDADGALMQIDFV